MYILVQAGTRKGASIVAIAASNKMDNLKAFAAKDAKREFGIDITDDWGKDQVFPYIVLTDVYTQYYIREIEYV